MSTRRLILVLMALAVLIPVSVVLVIHRIQVISNAIAP